MPGSRPDRAARDRVRASPQGRPKSLRRTPGETSGSSAPVTRSAVPREMVTGLGGPPHECPSRLAGRGNDRRVNRQMSRHGNGDARGSPMNVRSARLYQRFTFTWVRRGSHPDVVLDKPPTGMPRGPGADPAAYAGLVWLRWLERARAWLECGSGRARFDAVRRGRQAALVRWPKTTTLSRYSLRLSTGPPHVTRRISRLGEVALVDEVGRELGLLVGRDPVDGEGRRASRPCATTVTTSPALTLPRF